MSPNRRQLREAWGQFLSQFQWDWFVSLSFRDEVGTFRAHRLVQWFLNDLERAAGIPIFWFRAHEYGERLGRFHMHLLIGNVAHLRRLDWMDEWNRRAGYARIAAFDRTRGAAFYCAKYVTKQSGDWELSDNLLAFRQYQPVLPLRGPTKQRPEEGASAMNAQDRQSDRRTPKRESPRQGQRPLSFVLPGFKSRPRSSIMDVYRNEVTRGRGRYREFFF